jgi:uncharacterized membrane protein YdcZ (DUF606 family)
MSRRRRSRPGEEAAREAESGPASQAPWWRTLIGQVGILAAVFAVTVLVAELAGAANLGVALGVGQIVFAVALMYLLLTR